MSDRVGNWLQTYTGGRFYPLDPRPEEVHLEDIAHALSMVCRFGGHVREFYCVGEHSVRVSRAAEAMVAGTTKRNIQLIALSGLLHDAAEAYIGDMIRPLKTQPQMAAYKEAEHKIECVLEERFQIRFSSRTVKEADNILCATEARDLMGHEYQWRCLRANPLPERIVPLSQRDAKAAFLARFEDLTK